MIFIYNFEYLMDKIIIITYPLLFLEEINNKRIVDKIVQVIFSALRI
jgi:hypothetical protein